MKALARTKAARPAVPRTRMAAKTLPKTKATASLAAYVDALQRDPLIVTSNGQPVAVLISIAGRTDPETIALSTSPGFLRIIARSRRRHGKEGGRSPAEMRRWLELLAHRPGAASRHREHDR